jgi:hypothetical protein
MTPARFRKLALSLEGVEERPHMDRAAFRTKRKIFATLGRDGRVNLSIQPQERREALMESFPETFFSLGGWTRLGHVGVDLTSVDDVLLHELVMDAYQDALPVPRRH